MAGVPAARAVWALGVAADRRTVAQRAASGGVRLPLRYCGARSRRASSDRRLVICAVAWNSLGRPTARPSRNGREKCGSRTRRSCADGRLTTCAATPSSQPKTMFLRRTNSSMPARPPSRPNPLCFIPPNGRARRHAGEAVDDHGADLERAGDALRPGAVARVHVGRQAEGAVVGLGDHLVLVVEAQHRQHRTEDLVAGQRAVVVDVAEHRRRDEVAVGQLAAQALTHR